MDLIWPLLLIIISCLVIWRSSHGFEVASDYLGRKFPPGIKGATINAIASSMPEFLTTIFFLFYLKDADGFSAGLAVSSGSALFNLLIIPALAVLMLYTISQKNRIVLKRKIIIREGLVLLLSQIIFIIILYQGILLWWHGLILVMIYISYLYVLFIITRRKRGAEKEFGTPKTDDARSRLGLALRMDLVSLVLRGGKVNTRNSWVLLGISTLVMTAGTWLLVYGTDWFGEESGIQLIFVAVVLSAAATSVPDTIISLKDAKKGNYDDALSNALGSNIFDIAFALGLPILLFNIFVDEPLAISGEALKFTQEVWVFPLLATIAALAIMLIGKQFIKRKAILLILIYALFLFFVGTQVEGDLDIELLDQLGGRIGEFLTTIADWLGGLFAP